MSSTGLLILTKPLSNLRPILPKVLEEASTLVSDTLYVYLKPPNPKQSLSSFLYPINNTREVHRFTSDFYACGVKYAHTLDVRILLGNILTIFSDKLEAHPLSKSVSVLLTDSLEIDEAWKKNSQSLISILKSNFINISPNLNFKFIKCSDDSTEISLIEDKVKVKMFPNVVVGGTFDHMHVGHKVLLTECCLLCEKKLTVGITDGDRNKKKVLWELIQPYKNREQSVIDFCSDVKPNIILEPIKIFDPFGPTITDPNLDCCVVSEETRLGGEAVLAERAKRLKENFSQPELVVVDLVSDVFHSAEEEDKISSSSYRRRLLGTLISPVKNNPELPSSPYRIGVTGGIASGKSNLCKELESLGAKVISCDLLGHQAYIPGTTAYRQLIQEFGEGILNSSGEVNRRQLGSIVFADKEKLNKLNQIVWPAIGQLAQAEIEKYKAEGVKIVVLEAAVLFEAGWDCMVHEVWAAFVPREDAINRLMERNKLSKEEAEKRIDSQISNEERISKSNVAICPQWEFEVTRKQVTKAWDLLQARVGCLPETKL